MKLRFEQLSTHLQHNLAAVYVIYGDEPLLIQEAADSIRSAASERGFSEREYLFVEAGFDWRTLLRTSTSLSLFTTRRILELRLGNAKPTDEGAKILQTYAQRPLDDVLLLLTCGKLDYAAQQSRWFMALEAAGVAVQVWPIDASQLPAWIEQRARAKGISLTSDAVALLVERAEGNLLAAAQEIQKLYLLFGISRITVEQLQTAVSDSARYSVYDLIDAALAGGAQRSIRVLRGLHSEGVEIALLAWALHREIRLLALMSFALTQGQPLETVLQRNRVREKRRPLLRRALQRSTLSAWRGLLRDCARLDRSVKGVEPGDPWDEALKLSLRLAGREIVKLSAGMQLSPVRGRGNSPLSGK